MDNVVEDLLRRIALLPQAALIDQADALRWVQRVLTIDPERAKWHVARAGGIGGSEAGSLVAWAYETFQSRATAGQLAKNKLLILPPYRSNDDTARGSFLEPHVQEVYEAKLTAEGRTWRRRDDIKALVEAAPHPRFPWLRASLDGVYEIDGRIVLVDFKCPSEDTLQSYLRHQDFHDYKAQLNHYCLVAEGHRVRIDDLVLALYDYRRAGTVGVHAIPIPRDQLLMDQIVAASSAFWNDHVMQGLVPEEARTPVLRADEGVPPEIEALSRRAVILKITSDKATKAWEEARGDIEHWVSGTGALGDGELRLGDFSGTGGEDPAAGLLVVKGKSVLDTEAAVARLRDLGMPDHEIEAMRDPDKYDPKKVVPAYDGMLRILADLQRTLAQGGDVKDFQESLATALAAAPRKQRGEFNVDKVTRALESFNEVPYLFHTEHVASGLPRSKDPGLEELRAHVGAALDAQVSAMAEQAAAPEELPEGPAPGR